jgi:hypothetical protein
MLTYEQLDFIADLYIPVLVIISLYFLVNIVRVEGISKALINMALLGGAVAYIYGLMFIDRYFLIWQSLNLDYSTHTALALVFVVFLALKCIRLMMFGLVSMLIYAGLMVYQDYHSVLDIVTTGVVVTPVVVWLLARKGSCGQAAG